MAASRLTPAACSSNVDKWCAMSCTFAGSGMALFVSALRAVGAANHRRHQARCQENVLVPHILSSFNVVVSNHVALGVLQDPSLR